MLVPFSAELSNAAYKIKKKKIVINLSFTDASLYLPHTPVQSFVVESAGKPVYSRHTGSCVHS